MAVPVALITYEDGEALTPFEREALIERHCGVWPQ
jgi:hypothetical protein